MHEFLDESTDHWEKDLIVKGGLELKQGNIFDWSFNLNFFKTDGIIEIQCVYKRIVEPADKYFDIYGSIWLQAKNIDALVKSVKKTQLEIISYNLYSTPKDFVYDRSENRDQVVQSLGNYGGEMITGSHYPLENLKGYQEIEQDLYQVFQFKHRNPVDPYNVQYDVHVAQFSRASYLPDNAYASHDYDGIAIKTDMVDSFISVLESLK